MRLAVTLMENQSLLCLNTDIKDYKNKRIYLMIRKENGMVIMSEKRYDAELAKAYANGYSAGFSAGEVEGKLKSNSPNEIRKACGLEPIIDDSYMRKGE